MMRRNSIRWRLPLTYAGIALLTALVLGTVLLVILRSYYLNLERMYLQGNAAATSAIVGESISQGLPAEAVYAQIQSLSFFSRVRIQLLDRNGQLLMDSGTPPEQQMVAVRVERSEERTDFNEEVEETQYFWSIAAAPAGVGADELNMPIFGTQVASPGPEPERMPIVSNTGTDVMMLLPTTDTLYGYGLREVVDAAGRRSNVVVQAPIFSNDGVILGHVALLEGPAYGWSIISSVAWGAAGASVIAVVLAGGLGLIASQRISAPLITLTEITGRMADGDLSARVELTRTDEIGMLATSFNEMASRIQETVTMLRRLFTDVAHELHTPLTALRTNLEMAVDEQDEKQQTIYLERAIAQIQRFEMLTSNLLTLSRIEAGVNQIEHTAVNLTDLVREAGEIYASRAEQAGLIFEVELPTADVMVSGSEIQLHRAVGNLLENAIKFTPSGSIRVCIGIVGDEQVEIQIADTGIGIDGEAAAGLFERFHRGGNAASYPGSGLGLAIVKAIITAHHGEVWVERGAASGTKFILRLPTSVCPTT